MAAQNWTTIQNACLVALSQSPAPYNVIPADFTTQFPQATSYAEDRINTDLALLNTRRRDTSTATGVGSRVVSLSAVTPFITVPESFALFSPAILSIQNATRYPFIATTVDFIDSIWPIEGNIMDPALAYNVGRYWALADDHTIIYAPTANQAYTCEIWGQYRPVPISAANPTTYLSTYYSGLLIAGCMVWLMGALLRNFGAASEDPRAALSWEQEYQTLLSLARSEEARRRQFGPGGSANEAPPASVRG
jgi:hypothetical protein